jgi:putative ABC transport system ATP-binding protein
MNNKVIEIHDIVKNYQVGSVIVRALRSLSVTIDRNEYVAIMGPSGSGKSTLMNLIGCLDTPTSGSYNLNNTDVSKMEDDMLAEIRNKRLGLSFRHLTCYQGIPPLKMLLYH